jgi:hypothetical protein
VCILCYILLLIARPADSYFLLLKAIDPCAGSSCTSFADSSSAPTPQVLAMRRTKDPVPIPAMAETIGKLAVRLHGLGKLLHLLLTGCNTVSLVLPICKHIDGMCAAAKQSVWVLATNSVWPGDLSTFLWSQYGSTVNQELTEFRCATRIILDEYTAHWRRQKIKDQAMAEHTKGIQFLSELVMLDRLDKVRDEAGFAVMAPL